MAMADGRVVRAGAVEAFPVETRWKAELVLGRMGRPWCPTGTVRGLKLGMRCQRRRKCAQKEQIG